MFSMTARSFLVLLAAMWVAWFDFGLQTSLGALFLALKEEFGQDRSTTTSVQAMFVAVNQGFGVMTGILVTKYGLTKVVLIGSSLVPLGFFLSYFATSLVFINVFVGLISAVGVSLMFVSSAVMLGRTFTGHQRDIVLSLHSVSISLAGMSYPFIFNWLLHNYRLQGTFLILSGFLLNNFAMGLVFVYSDPIRIEREEAKKGKNAPGLLTTLSQVGRQRNALNRKISEGKTFEGAITEAKERPSDRDVEKKVATDEIKSVSRHVSSTSVGTPIESVSRHVSSSSVGTPKESVSRHVSASSVGTPRKSVSRHVSASSIAAQNRGFVIEDCVEDTENAKDTVDAEIIHTEALVILKTEDLDSHPHDEYSSGHDKLCRQEKQSGEQKDIQVDESNKPSEVQNTQSEQVSQNFSLSQNSKERSGKGKSSESIGKNSHSTTSLKSISHRQKPESGNAYDGTHRQGSALTGAFGNAMNSMTKTIHVTRDYQALERKKMALKKLSSSFKSILSLPYITICIATATVIGGQNGYLSLLLDVFVSKGFTKEQGLLSFFPLHFCGLIARILPGMVKQLNGINSLLLPIVFSLCGVVGQLMILFSTNYVVLMFAVGLTGITMGGVITATSTVIPKIVGQENFPLGFGFILTIIGLLATFVGPVCGAIRDSSDNYHAVMALTAGMQLVGSCLFVATLIARKHLKKNERNVFIRKLVQSLHRDENYLHFMYM